MFETKNIYILDNWSSFSNCKATIRRRSDTPLETFCPDLTDIPNLNNINNTPIVEKLQLLAKWLYGKIDKCYRVDIQFENCDNIISYIESDKLPTGE